MSNPGPMQTSSSETSEAPGGTSGESAPPWMQPDAFFEPPVPGTYGYWRDKRTYDCARERLIMRLEEDKQQNILLIWTPDSKRVAPPEEFPEFVDAVRGREAAHQRRILFGALVNGILWGLLTWASSHRPGRAFQFHMIVVFGLAVLPFISSCWRLSRLRSFTAEAMSAGIADARYKAWMARRPIPWTLVLLGCLVTVGVTQYLVLPWISTDPAEGAIARAGIIKEAVRSGEWWRLLTGAFIHGHPLHLLFNATALIALSSIVESTFHRLLLPIIFISAILAGSIFSVAFLPNLDSVGSSGGIMGLLGFILTVGWLQGGRFPRAVRRSLFISAAVIAGIGIVAYELIDNAAHGGGLLAGVALGLVFAYNHKGQEPLTISHRTRIAGIVASFVIVGTTLLSLVKMLR